MVFGIPVRSCVDGREAQPLTAELRAWSTFLGSVAAVAAVMSIAASALICRQACAGRKEHKPEVTEGGRELVNARRLAQFVVVARLLSLRAPLTLGGIAVLAFTRRLPDPIMHLVLLSGSVLFVLFTLVFTFLPRLRTIVAVDVAVLGFMVFSFILPCFASTLEMYHPMICFVRVVHVGITTMSPDPRLFVPLSLCHCILQIVTILHLPLGTDALVVNIIVAVLSSLAAMVACIGTRSALNGMVLAQIKAEKLRNMEAAVRAILDMVCHAFVPLNEALEFRDDCPALAALLLRPAAAKAGDSFLLCVKEADRSRLSAFVEAAREMASTQTAQQICVSLVGAQCQEIFVRIYHFGHVDLITSSLTHFFGILEEDPEQQDLPRSMPNPLEPAVEAGIEAKPLRTESDSESQTSVRSVRTQQLREEAVITTWGLEGKPATLKLKTWLHWELLGESEASRCLFNFSEDANHPEQLLARLQDPQSFLRYAEVLHQLAAGGHDITGHELEHVRLWNPARTLCYQATIRVAPSSRSRQKEGKAVEMVLTLSQPRGNRVGSITHRRRQRREAHEAFRAMASAVLAEPIGALKLKL